MRASGGRFQRVQGPGGVAKPLPKKSPAEYTRLVASVLPKEFVFENAVAELGDDQVDELILKLRQRVLEARAAPPTLLASPTKVTDDDPEPRH